VINQFLTTILVLLAAALPVWTILRFWKGSQTTRRGLRTSLAWELLLVTFFIYAIVVISLTVIPTAMSIHGDPAMSEPNLIPMHSLLTCCIDPIARPGGSLKFCLENMIGNLLLLFPLGVFLPLVWERFRAGLSVLLTATMVSGLIELIQFGSRYLGSFRTADIDDVILNTAGALLGYYFFRLLILSSPQPIRQQNISGF
jgi:glycopeptide antibiotics resistance protein